ncbi:unnamed protein product [Paramecium octaurelia]|uniref:Transmembrane protein n=1 Tax=Paramecium octaurelia TaxID=43137 RepID=A0A8S1WGQ1_PAROT|nr:unnamed protein product [Paramecium octaurelia]
MNKIILLSLLFIILTSSRRVGESEMNQFSCIKQTCKQELQTCIQDEYCFSVIQLCNQDFDDTEIAQNMKKCLNDDSSSNKYIQCITNKCLKKLVANFVFTKITNRSHAISIIISLFCRLPLTNLSKQIMLIMNKFIIKLHQQYIQLMIKQSTIRFLFLMIYFSNFWNTFIAYYYLNLSLYQEVNQISFYLIMTILKIICPALGGFIIDHVQFNLNILFIGQWLTIVSYIYFIANIYQEIEDYLYFAIGFQILGQQLQIIIILTMISKHFIQKEIPQQQIYYKFLVKLLNFINLNAVVDQIITLNQNRLKYEKNIQLILSMIPFVILLSLAICIHRSFPIFRQDIYEKIPELQQIPISIKSNMLQALKDVCKTDVILISASASAVISIIQIWEQFKLSLFYKDYNKDASETTDVWLVVLTFAISEFPIILCINKVKSSFIDCLQIGTQNQKLDGCSLIFKQCYIQFFNLLYSKHTLVDLLPQFKRSQNIHFNSNYHNATISSTILIGIQKANQRTLGLSFGILSMSTNIYEIWVICVLSQLSKEYYHQLAVIYGFAICYTILGATLAKMLQFVGMIKISQPDLNLDIFGKMDT